MACSPLNNTIPESSNVDEVPIIMVDRGNCSFVTKVRNVQEAGGHIALIVNNNPREFIEDIFMADDGRGKDLVIPGVLITYQEGEILKDFIRNNKDNKDVLNSIKIEVDFEMENRSNIAKVEFFVNSHEEKFYSIIKDLYSHLISMKDYIDLDVYYISHSIYESNLEGFSDIKNCYGSGMHCHNPGKFGVADGRIFLDEDIKQKCLLIYAKKQNKIEKYLDYLNSFNSECLNKTNFTPECSTRIQLENDIPSAEINKCIHDSFNQTQLINEKGNVENFKALSQNVLLENDSKKKLQNFIAFFPAVNINNRNFWGSWTKENIVEDICASLTKKPQICYDEGFFKEKGYSFGSMFIVYLLIVLMNVLIFLVCRCLIKKRIRERIESTDINHKINTVVTSYLALREK